MAASPTPRPKPANAAEATAAWWQRHGADLAPGAIGVAFSGGADSTALLQAATALWPGRVVALHVHHGLQPAADDWALHCHMAHHTMGPMGHGIPNPAGVDQSGVEAEIRKMLPGYGAMGRNGMSEHSGHVAMGLKGPENTLPMMAGEGQFGPIEMGGVFQGDLWHGGVLEILHR